MARADRENTALKILLLTLLLGMQGVGQAHAVGHLVEGDSGYCNICSLSTPGSCPISDAGDATVRRALPQTVPAYTKRVGPAARMREAVARGPPLS